MEHLSIFYHDADGNHGTPMPVGTTITDWDILNTASIQPDGIGIVGCGSGARCESDSDCLMTYWCTANGRDGKTPTADGLKYCTRLNTTPPPFVIISIDEMSPDHSQAFVDLYFASSLGIRVGIVVIISMLLSLI